MIKDIYIKKQADESQPNIILLVFIYYICSNFLTHSMSLLFKIDFFVALCSNHPTAYTSTFFGVQVTFNLLAIIYFVCRYRSALGLVWTKVRFKRIIIGLLILWPLVAWQFSNLSDFAVLQNKILDYGDGDKVIELITDFHNKIWSRLQYGTSLPGVIYTSIFGIVAPCFEEIMISGFLLNYICRKKNIIWALAIVPFCFTLLHIPAFGFGLHLLPLLWAGYTYVLIRFVTGNILFSIGAHIFVNIIVFLPKWSIAMMHFIE
ncbi:MAG: CPBP family intramembrane metalloprotease [Planctomycetes bacterium]|nr:CPBP family intramembrane metalloprotease [Planctomycetota bacterium]